MSGPYGPRRMRYKGLFAIHGTDEPWLLSRFPRNYSHGCTRLSNAHIRWLFAHCPVGTPVWNVPSGAFRRNLSRAPGTAARSTRATRRS
jgi:hypothetical protein